MTQFRYPGAQPFRTNQQHIFFGRDQDIQRLYRLVTLQDLIVLYSKSGMGKSSLLNAGIIPKLEATEAYESLTIRFGAYNGEKRGFPLAITKRFLQKEEQASSYLKKLLPEENSLWGKVKQWQETQEKERCLLLIFDQFEELFTYPESAIVQFKKELVELQKTNVPQQFRDALEANFEGEGIPLTEEEVEKLHHPIEVKILFSIRSDRLSLLNQLSDYLPTILRNYYELGALNSEQAEDAILNPAYQKGSHFTSPIFDFEDEAIEGMIAFLTKNGKESIESFQLQILCQSIENQVIEKKLKTVSLSDIGDFEDIYKNYYDRQIALIEKESDRIAARELIEEGLIFEDEKRRLSMYEGQIFKSYNVSPKLLSKLVNCHLLRAEPSMQGGFMYELSHDTLVAPVLESKQKRKTREAEAEARLEMNRLRRKAEAEEKEKRRARRLAATGFLLTILSLGAFLIAGIQYLKTDQARSEIQRQLEGSRLVAEALEIENTDRTKAFRLAQHALEKAPDLGGAIQLVFNLIGTAHTYPFYKRSFEGHRSAITAVEYSNDGNSLLTASQDRTAKLWDLEGTLIQTFVGHKNEVTEITFSPDDLKILTSSEDKTVKLWLIDGTLLHTFTGYSRIVKDVEFFSNGTQFVTASLDGMVKIWQLDGVLVNEFLAHELGVSDVAISPDGQWLATGSQDRTARLWDMKGNLIHTFVGHKGNIESVDFSPDSTKLLTGSYDDRAAIWDLTDLNSIEPIQWFTGHTDNIVTVGFSKDSKCIVTCGWDDLAIVWNISGNILKYLKGHTQDLSAAAFSPNAEQVLTGGQDKTVKLWDLTPVTEESIRGHTSTVADVAFSDDGTKIITGSWDHTAKLWTMKGRQLRTFFGHGSSVYAVEISPDGKIIATAARDKTIKLWDENSNLIHTLSGHTDEVYDVEFSPDGQFLLSGGQDNLARLWSMEGELLQVFEGHVDNVYDVEFTPDGKKIVTGSWDETVKVWDLEGQVLFNFTAHDSPIYAIELASNGQTILSSTKTDLKIWRLEDGTILTNVEDFSSSAFSSDFSRDGQTFMTPNLDNNAYLYRSDGTLLDTIKGHTDVVYTVNYAPNGKSFVTGSFDNTAKLWDLTGQLLTTFEGSSSEIKDFFFVFDKSKTEGDLHLERLREIILHYFESEKIAKFKKEE